MTSNPVVANAIRAMRRMACNATPFKQGDFVSIERSGRPTWNMYFEVVRDDGNDLFVKDLYGVWSSPGGTVYIPAKDARKVSPADAKPVQVKMDIDDRNVKDAKTKMQYVDYFRKDMAHPGYKMLSARDCDLMVEMPRGEVAIVKKAYPNLKIGM